MVGAGDGHSTGPRLNEPAPMFNVLTTFGERSLSDYHGKWLVLFSHPADFTPVCTSEFIAFARAHEQFAAINTELLGLSVDSEYAHIAWMRAIKEKFGVAIDFPIIADPKMKVARAYGMIHSGEADTSAVRATFVIDPEGVLRAMLYYPLSTGRSVQEILRLVTALQTAATHKAATPEGWQPGDKLILPPPRTVQEAEGRADSDALVCTDWFYCEKSV